MKRLMLVFLMLVMYNTEGFALNFGDLKGAIEKGIEISEVAKGTKQPNTIPEPDIVIQEPEPEVHPDVQLEPEVNSSDEAKISRRLKVLCKTVRSPKILGFYLGMDLSQVKILIKKLYPRLNWIDQNLDDGWLNAQSDAPLKCNSYSSRSRSFRLSTQNKKLIKLNLSFCDIFKVLHMNNNSSLNEFIYKFQKKYNLSQPEQIGAELFQFTYPDYIILIDRKAKKLIIQYTVNI